MKKTSLLIIAALLVGCGGSTSSDDFDLDPTDGGNKNPGGSTDPNGSTQTYPTKDVGRFDLEGIWTSTIDHREDGIDEAKFTVGYYDGDDETLFSEFVIRKYDWLGDSTAYVQGECYEKYSDTFIHIIHDITEEPDAGHLHFEAFNLVWNDHYIYDVDMSGTDKAILRVVEKSGDIRDKGEYVVRVDYSTDPVTGRFSYKHHFDDVTTYDFKYTDYSWTYVTSDDQHDLGLTTALLSMPELEPMVWERYNDTVESITPLCD